MGFSQFEKEAPFATILFFGGAVIGTSTVQQ